MIDFNEKYIDLIERKYHVVFHENDVIMTDKYKTYGVTIRKNGKNILNQYSDISSEDALCNAHKIIQVIEKYREHQLTYLF